jgi:hypothetical protein
LNYIFEEECLTIIAIIKHLHPEKLAGPIEQPKLAIPANNHVVVSFVSGKTPSSLDITLDPPIKDINDGYKRILALRNEAWLALDIVRASSLSPSTSSKPKSIMFSVRYSLSAPK